MDLASLNWTSTPRSPLLYYYYHHHTQIPQHRTSLTDMSSRGPSSPTMPEKPDSATFIPADLEMTSRVVSPPDTFAASARNP
jgi:hypothetical protein